MAPAPGPATRLSPFTYSGRVRVPVGVLGPADQRRRRPVTHAAAVEDAELAGDTGRGGDLLQGHLLAELRPRVARAVGWFFQAIRFSTVFISAGSTPYLWQ